MHAGFTDCSNSSHGVSSAYLRAFKLVKVTPAIFPTVKLNGLLSPLIFPTVKLTVTGQTHRHRSNSPSPVKLTGQTHRSNSPVKLTGQTHRSSFPANLPNSQTQRSSFPADLPNSQTQRSSFPADLPNSQAQRAEQRCFRK